MYCISYTLNATQTHIPHIQLLGAGFVTSCYEEINFYAEKDIFDINKKSLMDLENNFRNVI